MDFPRFVQLFEEYYLSDNVADLGNFINGKLDFTADLAPAMVLAHNAAAIKTSSQKMSNNKKIHQLNLCLQRSSHKMSSHTMF